MLCLHFIAIILLDLSKIDYCCLLFVSPTLSSIVDLTFFFLFNFQGPFLFFSLIPLFPPFHFFIPSNLPLFAYIFRRCWMIFALRLRRSPRPSYLNLFNSLSYTVSSEYLFIPDALSSLVSLAILKMNWGENTRHTHTHTPSFFFHDRSAISF